MSNTLGPALQLLQHSVEKTVQICSSGTNNRLYRPLTPQSTPARRRSYSLSEIAHNNCSFFNDSSLLSPMPSLSPEPIQSPGPSRIVLTHCLMLLGPRLPTSNNHPAQEASDRPSNDDGPESEEETRRAAPGARAQGNGKSHLGTKRKKPSGGSKRKRARIAADDDEDSDYGTGTGTENRNCAAKSKTQSSVVKVTQQCSRIRPNLVQQGKQGEVCNFWS